MLVASMLCQCDQKSGKLICVNLMANQAARLGLVLFIALYHCDARGFGCCEAAQADVRAQGLIGTPLRETQTSSG